MKAVIKSIVSPDITELSTYTPEEDDNFGFLLELFIGAEGESGAELFSLMVCTPKWLSTKYDHDSAIFIRDYLMVFKYDYPKLIKTIHSKVSTCTGKSWSEIAFKIARFTHWEFEDHRP